MNPKNLDPPQLRNERVPPKKRGRKTKISHRCCSRQVAKWIANSIIISRQEVVYIPAFIYRFLFFSYPFFIAFEPVIYCKRAAAACKQLLQPYKLIVKGDLKEGFSLLL